MPDYPPTTPAAGWYTDPGDPRQERWWGGVDWTSHTRPPQAAAPAAAPAFTPAPVVAAAPGFPPAPTPGFAPAPAPAFPPAPAPGFASAPPAGFAPAPAPGFATAPAPAPALADVPGGGINPFAGRLPESVGIGSGSTGPAYSSGANDFSAFNAVGTSPFTTPPVASPAPSAWNQSGSQLSGARASNGVATVGLILSLVGLNIFGIIFSAIGLKKARQFEFAGEGAVGRTRSRWGMGLGVTSLILSLGLTAAYVLAAPQIIAFYLEQTGASSSIIETDDALGDPDITGVNDGTYDRATYEQSIFASYLEDDYPTPDSVTCPDAGSTAAGSTIVCTIVTGELTETWTTQYFEDGGYSTSVTSFSG